MTADNSEPLRTPNISSPNDGSIAVQSTLKPSGMPDTMKKRKVTVISIANRMIAALANFPFFINSSRSMAQATAKPSVIHVNNPCFVNRLTTDMISEINPNSTKMLAF